MTRYGGDVSLTGPTGSVSRRRGGGGSLEGGSKEFPTKLRRIRSGLAPRFLRGAVCRSGCEPGDGPPSRRSIGTVPEPNTPAGPEGTGRGIRLCGECKGVPGGGT
ncbi:hypothetical protein GCM10017771_82450 [Streptomyces capitiformicae]|uniref:Uncharacterized protein n=1 Tax=Streptomyces capitiformicae TaxID=2014920 RepID=A0A918ZLD6_9ACTN|nr:hypothetical protein GCM10017771_82450 [Streptomyces capitiformicae]